MADYIVYCVWLTVEVVVVYFLFIETGNISLEQTAAILDGTAVQNKLMDNVARATTRDKNETEVTLSHEIKD
jgi:hypothetical protein